ncbi:general secretion pathway protein C [Ramlibacter sp. H39-3-26]|uniref:type II secretion system protein N n=1 Tax=Curvibacter soli TaxID=3031331 RepID=UPI0023DA0315|nr:general secretion pathway protein C [Ramlibacter sp. H39-3-26]MDF1483727.1 general secretion pathway protein C [Ramlibacter sp. H39-3-26]
MVTTLQSRWVVGTGTFAVWALAAASAVYWGLRMAPADTGMAPPPPPAAAAQPDAQALARLLGAGPQAAAPQPGLASRLALVGVLAGRSSGGAALIAIDGKPARPFRVGTAVVDGMVLQSVSTRQARLGPDAAGPAALTLEMPARFK